MKDREKTKTRDWIASAEAEAQANTDRHDERVKKNWSGGDYKGCCKAVDPCEVHLELRMTDYREPCEGCSNPVVTKGEYEWEHTLCPLCETIKPPDFLEHVKARVLCKGEIEGLKGRIKYSDRIRWGQQTRAGNMGSALKAIKLSLEQRNYDEAASQVNDAIARDLRLSERAL